MTQLSEKEALSQKAKQYSSQKYALAILETAYSLLLLVVFLGSGLSRDLAGLISYFTPSRYLIIPLYLLAFFLAYYCFSFPINFYRSYILERKFCLSHQKLKDWLLDQLKSGLVSYAIALILISVFYAILHYFGNSWWLVISIFWIFFSLILAKLTPTLIIPLFFKYQKLSDQALRERILNLAAKMKVKILDVFEIDFSRKTLKANAAFVGVGNTRRVILADTLKDKYSPDEIEVILAHEFAHFKLRHLVKLVLANSAFIFISFYFIDQSSAGVLGFFSLFSLSEIAALPVVFLYLALFGIVTQPLENYISRVMEKNADRLALQVTGLNEAFISMMEKLASQNLADRKPHPLIKFFFFDHPPVDERIAMARP